MQYMSEMVLRNGRQAFLRAHHRGASAVGQAPARSRPPRTHVVYGDRSTPSNILVNLNYDGDERPLAAGFGATHDGAGGHA